MTWRDGVHLSGTPIWCDARRRRDVCFVSSADRVGRAGHGQLIATPLTLALLGAEPGGHLAVPLHRRFTLGTVRLELVASGRGPGAAALHVDRAGHGMLYAGIVRSVRGGSVPIEGAEVRACNAVVVAAPYGHERHRFPPLADVIAQTIAWARTQLVADRRPVLLVETALDGLEVAGCLQAAGIAVAAARTIRDAARRAGKLVGAAPVAGRAVTDPSAGLPHGTPPPGHHPEAAGLPHGTPPPGHHPELAAATNGHRSLTESDDVELAAPGREPRAVVWLASDPRGLARALGDRPRATALVSGRALDGADGADAAFAWSNASDREQLLEWIEATNAREVFVTGACAEAIAAVLGPRARVIGPPHQMTLFPREAAP